MASRTVWNLLIEAEVEDLHRKVLPRAPCHTATRHRVRVTNLSTLPCDVDLTQALPDPRPPRPLSFTGSAASATGWTTAWRSLSGAHVEDWVDLDLHGPAASNARIFIQSVRYRLATGPSAPGGLYTTVSGSPMPVDLRFTVT
jgi:hypothetical protein